MKYFFVEGIIRDASRMNDSIMQQHMAYTQKVMDEGRILISGLKEDNSGGVFMIKADSVEDLKAYLDQEPFKLNMIQDYRWMEFNPHFVSPFAGSWME